MLSFSGTLGGAGAGDEAQEAGVSNLLLPPGELERSVGVSGLSSPFRPALPDLPLLTGYHAGSQIDGCLFISSDATSLECSTCKKCYPNKQDYWDLTVSVGSTEYSESMPVATELFR